ncbi:hypothetical protein SNEBB_002132, partial [Seison nebaliae]
MINNRYKKLEHKNRKENIERRSTLVFLQNCQRYMLIQEDQLIFSEKTTKHLLRLIKTEIDSYINSREYFEELHQPIESFEQNEPSETTNFLSELNSPILDDDEELNSPILDDDEELDDPILCDTSLEKDTIMNDDYFSELQIRLDEELEEEDSEYFYSHYDTEYIKKLQMWYKESDKSTKWETARHRFKRIKSETSYRRLLKIDADKVKLFEKYDKLGTILFEKVKEMRSNYLTLSINSIRRIAFNIAKDINLPNFRASNGWIHKWKKTYRIGSRKVTKIINKSEAMALNPNTLLSFRTKVKQSMIDYELLMNTDDSGLNYEISRKRAMSHIGEKQTPCKPSSMNHISHSYTFQPTLCSNGTLLPKMMVILQEAAGHFGPRVKAALSVPSNIYLKCTKSGKSTN